MAFETEGPFVQMAAICERVLMETDGVISVVRVIDTWTIVSTGPDSPAEMPPFDLNISFVVILKAGAALGRVAVSLVLESPDGLRHPLVNFDANFTGDPAVGHNQIMDLRMHIENPGLYWLDVISSVPGSEESGTLLTRSPLRVVYRRN